MIRATTFKGKTVAVFGLGGSGTVAVRSLLEGGATVAAWDDSEPGRRAAAKQGVPLVDLSTADWSQFSSLVLAPGVPLTHPEPHWTVKKAHAAGVEIIGDVEIFARERAAHCPDAPFIAITGTNGKSTTTALIAHILRSAGKDVQMGGNIGTAILSLERPAMDRFHVVEMSSFQIDLTPTLKPTVGVLLNITPDHLDRHGPADDFALAMQNYAAIKERLIAGSQSVVIGVESGLGTGPCEEMFHHFSSHSDKPTTAFSRQRAQLVDMVWCEARHLTRMRSTGNGECLPDLDIDLSKATTLRGGHNAENAAAAFLACEAVGISPEDFQNHVVTFPGLAHRMEDIGHLGNVLFINDSKATNADSTEKALLSFPRDVFWILGGKPKEGGIESLRPYFERIVRAYLIGAASDEFSQTLDGDVAIIPCGTLDVAVARAAADAAAYARGEAMLYYNVQGAIGVGTHVPSIPRHPSASMSAQPVVLLSPACASYDQFKNFEVRGDAFRALVTALPGFQPRAGS
jgi:UDP-N-acetylmuramoylalanine--D-glutamate ligase